MTIDLVELEQSVTRKTGCFWAEYTQKPETAREKSLASVVSLYPTSFGTVWK